MADRRRINGPASGTLAPLFASALSQSGIPARPARTRHANQLRKIFLRPGLAPAASGSAYLELEPTTSEAAQSKTLIPQRSSLKLTCTVHGPRPLPRSAPFSPQLLLSTYVKFAPFASRQRRGYLRDFSERDLAVHLEAALRGVIIGDRWPKSGAEVVVTVLEAEDDGWWADEAGLSGRNIGISGCGMMTVLAGCITIASAALAEAGIDCVDLVSGGVAALVRSPNSTGNGGQNDTEGSLQLVLDPCPSEHRDIIGAVVVAYLESRDELTEIWMKGDVGDQHGTLIERAIDAAKAARVVLADAIQQSTEARLLIGAADGTVDSAPKSSTDKAKGKRPAANDVDMSG